MLTAVRAGYVISMLAVYVPPLIYLVLYLQVWMLGQAECTATDP